MRLAPMFTTYLQTHQKKIPSPQSPHFASNAITARKPLDADTLSLRPVKPRFGADNGGYIQIDYAPGSHAIGGGGNEGDDPNFPYNNPFDPTNKTEHTISRKNKTQPNKDGTTTEKVLYWKRQHSDWSCTKIADQIKKSPSRVTTILNQLREEYPDLPHGKAGGETGKKEDTKRRVSNRASVRDYALRKKAYTKNLETLCEEWEQDVASKTAENAALRAKFEALVHEFGRIALADRGIAFNPEGETILEQGRDEQGSWTLHQRQDGSHYYTRP